MLPFSSSQTSVNSALKQNVRLFDSLWYEVTQKMKWPWFELSRMMIGIIIKNVYIYLLSTWIFTHSTNNHGLRSNSDGCMAVPSLVQVIQSTPFVISKLRNLVFNVQPANNVCCIRSMSSGILRNTAEKLIMWKFNGVIFQDLLLAKRKIRTVRPFHGIDIKKFCREGTVDIVVITSDSECFSFIVSKAIWGFVTVLCRFNWTVIFAIEPSKIFLHQDKQ